MLLNTSVKVTANTARSNPVSNYDVNFQAHKNTNMLSASRWQARLLHARAADSRLPSNLVNEQELTICDTVWISPQSHSSLSVKPHFLWHALVALACPKTIQQ